jgi:ATP-dependent RNA helicase DDX18/HAS1
VFELSKEETPNVNIEDTELPVNGVEEESPSFNNSIYRRQSTGVTSSNYDTYTNYDPVESVVGGYSTLDVSRRSSTYNGGNGLDYSKRSGSCGLFSIYDDVDNNVGEEEGRPVVPIWIKNKAASRNKAASVQSGHTELMKQHSLVDWAEYPTSPGTDEEDDLNASEEDFADDDVSEEHYRSLDRRCSINNKDKGVSSSPKEDINDKQEKGEEVSNNQLVVRRVLDPEEASFAEQEHLSEYDETKAVIVPDSTPVPDTKTPSSKGIVQQSHQSPSATSRTVNHTNDNKQPIDTSKQYNGFQHTFITIKEEHRFLMLYTFLKRNVNTKIIIFFSTTKSTQYYCKLLQRLKFTNVNCVHNGMGRDRFMNALVEFSKGSAVGEGDSEGGGNNKGSILCIPDFQASDISIPPSTTWLVQFEPPANPTEYIYRVGRISSETTTASNSSSSHRRTRSNSTGGSNSTPATPSRALLFLTPNEYGFLKYYKAANIKIYEYEISKIAKIQKQIVKLVHDDNKLHKLGVEAYHAYLGTYASHEYKDIYNNSKEDDTEDNCEKLIAKCFGFESIPGKVLPCTKRVASNNRKSFKRNDKLRGSLVKKQDSKDKLRGSLVKKRDKDKVVPQDDEEKVTTTPQGRNKSRISQDEKKVTTPQDKKKKIPQDNSPRASRSREQNRWKPVKHEQHAPWMSGKTKSWRASNVHADKMKIQSKKNLDEYHPKIVKLPKAA